MLNKRSEFPLIKTIIILFIVAIIFITYIIILVGKQFNVNDAKFKTQIIYDNLFSTNCLFSKEFGIINLTKFTNKNLLNCFHKINGVGLRVDLYLNNKYYKTIYYNSNFFKQNSYFCNIKNNLFCNEMIYPIIYDNNGDYENAKIIVWSIVR